MNWREDFQKLDQLNRDVSRQQNQERGRQFEKVLRDAFREAGMFRRVSYRPSGEEIDGSFVHRDRVYLYEANGRVRRKRHRRCINSEGRWMESWRARSDVRAEVRRQVGIKKAMDFKLREAIERGTPFVPLSVYLHRKALQRGTRAIIVERQSDAVALSGLISRFEPRSAREVISAGGLENIP